MYDREEDKRIEEAKVTLIDSEAIEETTKTNNLRDFWLKELRVGIFSLLTKEVGYYPQEIKSISTGRNVNVGDIKLYKKA